MAQNAKDIQMRELKDLLNELRETNKLLRKTLEETQKEKAVLQQERDNFKEQVNYLTKKLFGLFWSILFVTLLANKIQVFYAGIPLRSGYFLLFGSEA